MYGSDYKDAIRLSPDGQRYLVIFYRGDLQRNGNWVEFFSGTLNSFEAAASGKIVANLFTTDHEITHLLGMRPVWLADNERVAFIWHDGVKPGQVVTLNLRTQQLETLTNHPRNVDAFDITPDGRALLFTSRGTPPDFSPRFAQDTLPTFAEMLSKGFAVPNSSSIYGLLNGYPDEQSRGSTSHELFFSNADKQSRQIAINGHVLPPMPIALSPDGRRAIVVAPPTNVPPEWDKYTDGSLQRNLGLERRNATEPNQLRQLWLVDLERGDVRALWNAPYHAVPPPVVWSADSRSILLSRTFLPVDQSDGSDLAGTAAVEVAIPSARATRLTNLSSGLIGNRFRRIDGQWEGIPSTKARTRQTAPAAKIELREDPNTPPQLVAVDTQKSRSRVVFDPTPDLLTTFTLGRVEIVHWTDTRGNKRSGRLYYPTTYVPTRRYPLAILTVPAIATLPQQFSLRGSELHACVLSIAQPLANRDMVVLVMIAQPDDRTKAATNTPEEADVVMAGYESAIRHFSAAGLIAADKVGIVGYSRTGSYVQHALTHSAFSFAAAISADNIEHSYLRYLFAENSWTRDEFERVNGSPPYGEGLLTWFEKAPGFNADKIRTPLRLERNSGGLISVLAQWELFSHLRALQKPVEFYVIPEIERGSHGLLLPKQQLASLESATDWMDFWLNDRELVDESKQEQYVRWRELRRLQQKGNQSEPATQSARTR
jgi:hypothetical protein